MIVEMSSILTYTFVKQCRTWTQLMWYSLLGRCSYTPTLRLGSIFCCRCSNIRQPGSTRTNGVCTIWVSSSFIVHLSVGFCLCSTHRCPLSGGERAQWRWNLYSPFSSRLLTILVGKDEAMPVEGEYTFHNHFSCRAYVFFREWEHAHNDTKLRPEE